MVRHTRREIILSNYNLLMYVYVCMVQRVIKRQNSNLRHRSIWKQGLPSYFQIRPWGSLHRHFRSYLRLWLTLGDFWLQWLFVEQSPEESPPSGYSFGTVDQDRRLASSRLFAFDSILAGSLSIFGESISCDAGVQS